MEANELWHKLHQQIEKIKTETDALHHPVLEKACLVLKETIDQFSREQVAAGLPYPHPRSRIYRSEPKAWQIIDRSSDEILDLIIQNARKSTHPTACIFDLDGTLFDVSYRTLGIIKEWLESEKTQHQPAPFDEYLLKKIARINYSHIGYSLSHAFENAGFDLRNQETINIFSSVERVWKKKFFDGMSLLKYDHVMENSCDFVKKIKENNIQIFYLTGRHAHAMQHGTVEQLKKFGFPIEKNNIILKENTHTDDQLFKAEKIKEISKTFHIVGNFENEYLNIAFMAPEVKEAVHVVVDTQHSGRPTPKLDLQVYRISQYDKVT